MKIPCETAVWEVLPCIRASLAEELVERGLLQKDISRLLGIRPPTVSQYVSKKRGCNVKFNDRIKASISRLADDIANKRVDDLSVEICAICKMLQKDDACLPYRGKE